VLARSDSLAAALFWLTLVEPVRPDVAGIARQHAWDVARSAAVLGAPAAWGVAGLLAQLADRPVLWELGDDNPPPGWPLGAGVPVGTIGRTPSVPLERQIERARRAFAPPATDDDGAAAAAARAFMTLGVLAARVGDIPRALALAERAAALGDDPVARLNLARWHLTLGDDDAARVQLVAALAARPRRAAGWSLLGVLDARAGRCAAAQRALLRALALDAADHDAVTNLLKLPMCVERR
jgi:tetratricopeptide (TPR) repeat protein